MYVLPDALEFFSINFSGGTEVIFDRLSGNTSQPGFVFLRVKDDPVQIKAVYILASGTVDFQVPPTALDSSRIKDSRHVHADYSRTIATATENLVLNFNNGAVVQNIPIASHLSGGQISWQGTVAVAGSSQELKITTHVLNNPTTQFSISRDRRFNNASLKISLSGDASGHLVNYASDGLFTDYASVYVSNVSWQ